MAKTGYCKSFYFSLHVQKNYCTLFDNVKVTITIIYNQQRKHLRLQIVIMNNLPEDGLNSSHPTSSMDCCIVKALMKVYQKNWGHMEIFVEAQSIL